MCPPDLHDYKDGGQRCKQLLAVVECITSLYGASPLPAIIVIASGIGSTSADFWFLDFVEEVAMMVDSHSLQSHHA